MNGLDDLLPMLPPTADRPLAGLTLLLVEDSRLASEAMRLLCRRSGARLRRADTIEAAERHLRTYRPGGAVVDLHLPDGSGLSLISVLARQKPRLDALLAVSGDPGLQGAAIEAGADGFLLKPVPLGAFQVAVLACLPPERRPPGLRAVPPAEAAPPDAAALRGDLELAAALLSGTGAPLDYLTGFLRGVALSAGDAPLGRAVERAASSGEAAPLLRTLNARLAAQPTI